MQIVRAWTATWLALVATAAHAAPDVRVEIANGSHRLPATPILARLDASVALAPGDYLLDDRAELKTRIATVFELDGARWLAFPIGDLAPGETRTLVVGNVVHPADVGGGVSLTRADDGTIDITTNQKPFATLQPGPNKPYFFPVIGPGGKRFTRAFPMEQVAGEDRDHFHQRSMWFTYGDVNGFDFWASDPLNPPNPKFGTIKASATPELRRGLSVGVLRTTNSWLDPKHIPILNDTRIFRFWDLGDARLIDCDISLTPCDGPVRFGDTKEGAFGLRVPSSMDVKNNKGGKITNAEGVTDNDTWGKRSAWVDYSGPIENETCGIAILNHPESFRYPTAWHVRDYGLFAANPFGKHDFALDAQGPVTLEPGNSITLRYRVILHRGDSTTARVADQFEAFATPPRVRVVGP